MAKTQPPPAHGCEMRSKHYCNVQDVKRCQMKSESYPHNVYKGGIFYICAGCRSALNGQFKFQPIIPSR